MSDLTEQLKDQNNFSYGESTELALKGAERIESLEIALGCLLQVTALSDPGLKETPEWKEADALLTQ